MEPITTAFSFALDLLERIGHLATIFIAFGSEYGREREMVVMMLVFIIAGGWGRLELHIVVVPFGLHDDFGLVRQAFLDKRGKGRE